MAMGSGGAGSEQEDTVLFRRRQEQTSPRHQWTLG
uniref:Survival of motor neuron n=1 Tax=Mus musculus TaxID=10090 RepID=Q5PXT5_MOUSE|nr:survival of motor neuron [Mus musculus]